MPANDLLARFRRHDLGGSQRRPSRLAWLLVPIALLALWSFWIEPSRLVERHPALTIDGLPPVRLALLSDVHAGSAFVDRDRLREVVTRLNAAQPDVIALLGDYVTEGPLATPIPPEETAAILSGLRAPGGVYAVLGNHDNWHDGDRVARAFTSVGLRVLDAQKAEVTVRGRPLTILGIPDESTRRPLLRPTWALLPPAGPVIGLTHSPDVFPESPPGVTLMVAGHTHGGQVRLPLIGSPMAPTSFGDRYVLGHVTERGHHLYVTTGLGTSLIPVRLGVPPEIVVLHINGA